MNTKYVARVNNVLVITGQLLHSLIKLQPATSHNEKIGNLLHF
jgi:hypothetical protein